MYTHAQVYTCHAVWRSKGFSGCWSLTSTLLETGSLAPAAHSRLSGPKIFWRFSPHPRPRRPLLHCRNSGIMYTRLFPASIGFWRSKLMFVCEAIYPLRYHCSSDSFEIEFFKCVCVSACMYVCIPCMCRVSTEARRGDQIQWVVKSHMAAGNRTWVLWNSSQPSNH